MHQSTSNIIDPFGRTHTYLRISLTERCNLRCTYCMPEEGVKLSPRSQIMNAKEVIGLAKEFVSLGVTKIRLTGGEPLVKKGIDRILRGLSQLKVDLSITTNALILDRYIDLLKETGVRHLNISIDTLSREKYEIITRRDQYLTVLNAIHKVSNDPFFKVKLNAVLIKGFNDMEIIDFIELTKEMDLSMRFIEFMPFDGNRWNMEKLVSQEEVLSIVHQHYQKEKTIRLIDQKNDTARNFKIEGFKGTFAIISTVTNPFCDSCNRIRLMANGKIKNCLFSTGETDLLTHYRAGKDIKPLIQENISAKKESRGGLIQNEAFTNTDNHKNRSMIMIGG